MSTNIVRLRNKEDMLAQLLKVSNDSHIQLYFIPLLLKYAGHGLSAGQLALRISVAISEYSDGIQMAVFPPLIILTPNFVDAMVDDKEFAAEAKALCKN